jgi:hypothetical protein
MARLLLVALLSAAAFAQKPPQQRYLISIGAESSTVSSGAVWLYSYSWYGLQKLKLADIENGRAVLSLDTEKLQRDLNPHPNTEVYVLVVQVGERLWYRTPNISPKVIWTDLPRVLNSLGRTAAFSSGQTRLILPSPAKRRITMLYPDGRTAANTDVPVSVYLYDYNHCGGHEGLPLGTFRTDATGTIEFLAPLVALYLDDVSYYENVGAGPAGVAYSHNVGLKTSPEEKLVLKEQWELNDHDSLLEEVELRVLTGSGRPRPGINVYGQWRTNTCGGGDRIGQTDSNGIARIDLDPSFTALGLMIGGPYSAGDPEAGNKTRDLADAELRELFSKHKLTIRW